MWMPLPEWNRLEGMVDPYPPVGSRGQGPWDGRKPTAPD